MPNLFNVGALFVLLREFLEASIVIGVLFNFLNKTIKNDPIALKRAKRWVWYGAILGLVISLIIGVIFTVVYYVLRQNVFESVEPLWEGCFQLIAAFLLTWMAFAMLNADSMYDKWERKLQTMQTVNGEAPKAASPMSLLILSFTVIVREGVESIIFLTGVGQGEPESLIIPGAIGAVIGIAIGYAITSRIGRFKMHKFFVISSIILFVIAAGLASNTAHEFEEYGYLRAAEWRANYLNETLPKIITPPDFVNYVPTTKSIKFTAGLASKKTGPFSIHARSFDDSALHKPIRRSDSGLARRQSGTAANVTYPTFTNSPPLRQTIAESACPSINGTRRASCTVRTYFVAAEEEAWDYAPSGYNHFNGVPFVRDPEGAGVFTLHAENRIGSVYYKTMFYEYEDATFTNRKAKPSWLGGIGPILRAEVGDVIKIVFKNNGTLPYSMHPHGVFYNVSSEGATTQWNQEGTVVAPGTTYNYTWSIPERAGPGPADSSSILWAYHSHNMEVQDVYSGLVGPLLVYKTGTLNPTTDLPNDVDKEYVLMFTVMDENTSHFIGTNIGLQMPRYFNRDTQLPLETAFNDEFKESNLMHSVNFRMYNNLDGLFVSVGDKVRWHVFAMGTEVDLHTVHWHGNTLLHQGSRVDAIELLPASFKTLDMTVDDAGTWLIHCHVADHITAGMVTSFEAFPRTSNSPIVVNNFTTFLADREKVTESPESTPILWNTEDCCSEESNAFFSILNSLIGYRAKATVATVVTYILYWIIIICVWWLFVRKQRVGRGNEKKTSEEGDENSGREDGALLVDEEKAETEGDEVKVVIEAQKEESKSTLLGSEDK